MRRTMTLTALVALALAVSLAMAPDARADVVAWDAAKVTALAGELAGKTAGLVDAVRQQPPETVGQVGRRAWFRLRDELATITGAASSLHRALEAGATQEETYPTFGRLVRSVRRAAADLSRVHLLEGPARDKVYAAGEVLRRIRPFYEDEPPI